MSTKIEWCTETWNPVTGCTPISEGCAHCYAKRMAQRLRGRYGYAKDDPFRVTYHPNRLDQPLKWKKPRRIFVCSMGDLFHEDVDYCDIASVFGVAAFNPHHTFLFLTKRGDRMLKFFSMHDGDYKANWYWWQNECCLRLPKRHTFGIRLRTRQDIFPLPNLWLGVTLENDKHYERIEELLKIPAAVRFVSIEPCLSGIDLRLHDYAQSGDSHSVRRIFLNWAVFGCESGPGRRPMKLEWAVDVVRQCKEANVPCFVKQIPIGNKVEHDIKKFPAELQIREYPNG